MSFQMTEICVTDCKDDDSDDMINVGGRIILNLVRDSNRTRTRAEPSISGRSHAESESTGL